MNMFGGGKGGAILVDGSFFYGLSRVMKLRASLGQIAWVALSRGAVSRFSGHLVHHRLDILGLLIE